MKTNVCCPQCGIEISAEKADGKFGGVCPKCLLRSILPSGEGAPLAPTEAAGPPSRALPPVGGEFGNYVIQGVLGAGGMGIVYKARQKGLERAVALKLLSTEGVASADLVERFFREARAAASLKHPNIVPIHEVSSHEGTYFYSMELVEGETFSQRLRNGDLEARESAEILAKVARAVHFAHEKGIVHRDLKPSNVMIDSRGEPKVLDFGIAKTLSTRGGSTKTGDAMGTPPYMSPEQAAGAKDLDARADVYSLGAMLYEALTGRPPFTGSTVMEVIRKLATADPIPPSKLNAAAPRDLEVICLKALEKEKVRRYGTAEALAEDLDRYLKGRPINARPARWTRKGLRFLKSRAAWAAAVALLLVAAGATYSTLRIYQPRRGGILASSSVQPAEVRGAIERARRTAEIARFGTTPKVRRDRHKNLKARLADLDRVIRIHPTQGELYYWKGRLWELTRRPDKAIEEYSRALEQVPDLVDARYRRSLLQCFIYFRTDLPENRTKAPDWKQIRSDVRELKKRDLRPEQAVLLDGVLRHAEGFEGRLASSSQEYLGKAARKALELNPAFADALRIRVPIVAVKSRDRTEIIRACEAVLTLEPNDADFLFFLGYLRLLEGDCLGGLTCLQEVVELGLSNHVRHVRALIFWGLGLSELALRELDKELQAGGDEFNQLAPLPGMLGVNVRATRARIVIAPYLKNPAKAPKDVVARVVSDLEAAGEKAELAYVRRVFLGDGAGARRLHEASGSNVSYKEWEEVPEVFVMGPEGRPPAMDPGGGQMPVFMDPSLPIPSICAGYAKWLCGRLEQGAEREEVLPQIVAMLRRAVERGYRPTKEEFAIVKDEPELRTIWR